MIKELTTEQQAKFPEYVKKWVEIGTNTDTIDFDECVKQVGLAYGKGGIEAPKFVIGPVNNPYEAAVAEHVVNQFADNGVEFDDATELNNKVLAEVQRLIGSDELNNSKLSISNQIYGFQEYWLSYYDYFINECGLDLNLVEPLINLSKVCGWLTPLQDVVIIQHRPLEIHRDAEGRLHNVNGAAVKYRGVNSDVYSVHGVRVTKKIVDRDFTVADIENENNAEVRRVMIELYGQAKFLMESGAVEVHKDEFGVLYRKDLANDPEPLMMVKVVNSTAEPDGSFKDYFIRVDPKAYGGLKTARAAVASTWRADGELLFKTPEEYTCNVES